MQMQMCICIYVYMYICICMCISIYVYMYICICTCTLRVCVRVCVRGRVHLYVYMYILMYYYYYWLFPKLGSIFILSISFLLCKQNGLQIVNNCTFRLSTFNSSTCQLLNSHVSFSLCFTNRICQVLVISLKISFRQGGSKKGRRRVNVK